MDGLTVEEALERLAALHGQVLGALVERRHPRPDGRPTRLQEFALRAIREGEGLPVNGLAALLEITPATTSQLLGVMEEKGWIERDILPEDRRRHRVCLTSEGRRVVGEMEVRRRARLAAVLAELAPAERAQLVALAERLVSILSRQADASGEGR